ncbi:hypothetical protein [uncultured Roseovarius sp.]|nr:hypothetical protein [uncultured Roseovarius sp.]
MPLWVLVSQIKNGAAKMEINVAAANHKLSNLAVADSVLHAMTNSIAAVL